MPLLTAIPRRVFSTMLAMAAMVAWVRGHASPPVLPGADPHAVLVDGAVWIFPTWSDTPRGPKFFGFSSTNLTDWKRHGPLLDLTEVPWVAEGAFMHEREGRYYLSYSHGGWQHASYSVHYATAPTPTGPWTYEGPILTSDATRKGPGHHSFLHFPGTDDWRIVYHRWENQTGNGPYKGSRQICIDRIEHGADGRILPIRMSDQPPAPPTSP